MKQIKDKVKHITEIQRPIENIKVSSILPPRTPTRSSRSDISMQELVSSIGTVGLLNPITVMKEGTAYRVMAGHRRLDAIKQLGCQTIKCTVYKSPGTPSEFIQLHENLIREQVRPTDEARFLRHIMTLNKWTAARTAEAIGRTESWVSDRLSLLNLPANLTDKVDNGEIPYSAARELGRVKDPAKRNALIEYAVRGGVDTNTAATWRKDADNCTSQIDGTPIPQDPDSPPVPVKMMCSCEVCAQPHDITESRQLKLCANCYKEMTTRKA